MKIIITESQFDFLLMETDIPIMDDYSAYNDEGMRGTRKLLGMDYFPKNLIFKILEYNKLKYPNDSEIVSLETKIKNQNRMKREDRKKIGKYIGIVNSDCKPGSEVSEKYSSFCFWVKDLTFGDSDNRFSASYGFGIPGSSNKDIKENSIDEKWTDKYKKSIDCSNPKGFSQRAHCQGRKKKSK